jgi:hypothetical protein
MSRIIQQVRLWYLIRACERCGHACRIGDLAQSGRGQGEMPTPTVRIKRSDYSTLRERAQNEEQQPPQSLASLFRRPRSISLAAYPPLAQTDLTGQDDPFTGTTGRATGRPLQRRRANSRIQDHFISRSLGRSQHPPGDAHSLTSASSGRANSRPPSPFITLRGSNTDIVAPRSDIGPGVLGSTLSLSRPSDDHHEDDIVEHLDVIGAYPLHLAPKMSY